MMSTMSQDDKDLTVQSLPTAESEDAAKEQPVTPPLSQELGVPAVDNTGLTGSVVISAIESVRGSIDSNQSAKPSGEVVHEDDHGINPTVPESLDPVTPNRRMDRVVEDMQAHRDELGKENDELKAQIQQLNIKIRDVEMLGRSLPTRKGREEEEDEFERWEAARRRRERRRARTILELEENRRFDKGFSRKPLRMAGSHAARRNSSNDSSDFDDLEKASEEAAEDKGEQINATPLDTSKLNIVSWVEFQLALEGNSGQFAIDVLLGPILVLDNGPGGRRRGRDSFATTAINQRKTPGKDLVRGQAPLPERIRINSKAILTVLSKIHGEDLSRKFDPVLMMQPFRALVLYKDEIRKWKIRLEAKFEEARTTGPKSEIDGITEQDNDISSNTADAGEDSKSNNEDDESEHQEDQVNMDVDEEINKSPHLNDRAALDDLNCLVEFVEGLEDKIAYLASDQCQRVAFNDIWHLFKPGDLVLSKDEKQAYRVVNVKFPTHRMKMPSAKDIWLFDAKAKLENSPLIIQCAYIDFDGEQIGPCLQSFSISRFDGEKNIRSLDILPFRLAKKSDLENTLIKRGSAFIEACDPQRRGVPLHYLGFTLETQEEVDSQVVIDFEEAFVAKDGGGSGRKLSWTTEQLVLEAFASALRDEGRLSTRDVPLKWKPVIKNIEHPEETEDAGQEGSDSDSDAPSPRDNKCIPECCSTETVHDDTYVERNRCNEFIWSQQGMSGERIPSLTIAPRLLKEATEDENSITDDEKLIINYRVFGFIMRSRKWAKLDLAYLGPPRGENTFDLLVLPPGHRRMVESLVTQHFLDKESASDDTDEVDIVRGKGKGLILLLHGAPGVGKTTTAECVATYFHKPLFQITCGDLGATADVVESRLETNFALASRWGCILLIDEADVFLEARQTENFDRNSLVAVFLRALEYYTGILFLTTNRVGTFDEAFTSRIHISLYYPPLSPASTLAVFKVNLTRIKERFSKKKERGEAELELNERSIDEFILRYYTQHEDARWNGRQIRNACQTALALAEFEAQKLANPGISSGRSVMEVTRSAKKMIKVHMSAKHFRDVAKAYLAFMRYLKEVHGVSAAQQAKNYRLRQDRYGLGEPASLLASRQRPVSAETGPSNRRRADVGGAGGRGHQLGQQGWRKTGHHSTQDEYAEAGGGLDEYMYGEEDLYNQGDDDDDNDDEDVLQNEHEVQLERGSQYEQEYEYDGNEYGGGVGPDPLDDELAPGDYAEEPGAELSYDEYDNYGMRPKAKPRPGPSRTGYRGQQTTLSHGVRRGGGGDVGAGASIGRSSGRPEGSSTGRGHVPPGRAKVQPGAASRGRGQGRLLPPRID